MNSRRLIASNFVCIWREMRETQKISYSSALRSFQKKSDSVSPSKPGYALVQGAERRKGRDRLTGFLRTCLKKRLNFTFSFVSAQQKLNGKMLLSHVICIRAVRGAHWSRSNDARASVVCLFPPLLQITKR